MRGMADNSVDLIFADPPFNLGRSYGTDNDSRINYREWTHSWLDQSIRVLKDGGVLVVHNIPEHAIWTAYYLMDKLNFQNWVAWKTANMPIINRLLPEHFAFIVFSKGKPRTFNRWASPVKHKVCRHCGGVLADWGGKVKFRKPTKRVSDVWLDIERLRHNKNKTRSHNELPLKVPSRFMELYTNENDTILDPFLGSGTTALAAHNLNRNYIGIEISAEYVKIAQDRLKQEVLL